MKMAMIGLGKMGANMSRRLMRGGHEVVAFDLDADARQRLAQEGARPAATLREAMAALEPPRVAWVMVPAGKVTESVVRELADEMQAGDVIVDGGNSFYHDDVRRAQELAGRGIHYVDAGTSGGVWGLERGYCLMVGGEDEVVERITPLLETLAPGPGDIPRTPGREGRESTAEKGYLHCGPAGSGHYVKMVHNGIEYGVMQAYAEGLDLLRSACAEDVPEERRFAIDVADVCEVWRRGSVIGSWLLDLTAMALAEDGDLGRYSGFVNDSGEGRWTVQTAVEQAVPCDVLTAALYRRFRSRQDATFADKVLSAMRAKFGGHAEGGDGA